MKPSKIIEAATKLSVIAALAVPGPVGSVMTMASSGCVDPDLSKVAQGTDLTMCDGTIGRGTYVAPDLSALIPANINAGVTINQVVGTWAGAPCNGVNQTGCVTSTEFPSIGASSLSEPYDFRATSGGFGKLKYCRSAYNLSVYDHPATQVNMSHIGRAFTGSASTDLITVSSNVFIESVGPVPIRFTTTGTLPAPLVTGTTYYSIWTSTTTIKVAATQQDATSNIALDLTTDGSGSHRMYPVGDGVPQYWDVGTSLNSYTTTPGPWFTQNYFGPQYLCTLDDWRVLAPSPDGAVTQAGTSSDCDAVADDCMFEDRLTRQVWSEVNPKGSGGSLTWAESRKFCDELVFGGFSDWRLPQIKEFAQAYINGLARTEYSFPAGGTSPTYWMWSVTTQGNTPWNNSSNFIYMFYGSGEFQTADAASTSNATRCVRN